MNYLTLFEGKTFLNKLWPLLDLRAKLDLKLTNYFITLSPLEGRGGRGVLPVMVSSESGNWDTKGWEPLALGMSLLQSGIQAIRANFSYCALIVNVFLSLRLWCKKKNMNKGSKQDAMRQKRVHASLGAKHKYVGGDLSGSSKCLYANPWWLWYLVWFLIVWKVIKNKNTSSHCW